MERWLGKFADWFASVAGIIQTSVFVAVVLVVEWFRPSLDPHGFWLLFWLTVYSGITQPVLAFCARRASDKADRDVSTIKLEEDHIEAIVQAIAERLK